MNHCRIAWIVTEIIVIGLFYWLVTMLGILIICLNEFVNELVLVFISCMTNYQKCERFRFSIHSFKRVHNSGFWSNLYEWWSITGDIEYMMMVLDDALS